MLCQKDVHGYKEKRAKFCMVCAKALLPTNLLLFKLKSKSIQRDETFVCAIANRLLFRRVCIV